MSGPSRSERMKTIESKTRNAAKMYEKTFLRQMVKAMRQTIPKGGMVKRSMAEGIFEEKLDHKYVDSWADKGGVGLADIIYDQIVERFGSQLGMRTRLAKPRGPLPFKQTQHLQVSGKKIPNGASFTMKNVQKSEGRMEITSPWPGMLLKCDLLPDGRWMAEVGHDSGLVSKLVFSGQRERSVHERVEAGTRLGFLSEEANDFIWQINAQQIPNLESVADTVSL